MRLHKNADVSMRARSPIRTNARYPRVVLSRLRQQALCSCRVCAVAVVLGCFPDGGPQRCLEASLPCAFVWDVKRGSDVILITSGRAPRPASAGSTLGITGLRAPPGPNTSPAHPCSFCSPGTWSSLPPVTPLGSKVTGGVCG